MIRLGRGKLLAAFVPLMAAACTSISVKKVTSDNVPGIRYALPKPFIQVTPNADGSVTVEQVYLPDDKNTYAINATAYASSLTLDISIEKGLLKKIEMKPDATAVTEQVIKTAGEVGSKVLDAEKANQEAQRKKIETADAKVVAALEAVAKAQLDIELAQIDKASADRGKDEAAKEKARVELEKAQARLKAAVEALNKVKVARGALNSATKLS